jgi:hypothetical protein
VVPCKVERRPEQLTPGATLTLNDQATEVAMSNDYTDPQAAAVGATDAPFREEQP